MKRNDYDGVDVAFMVLAASALFVSLTVCWFLVQLAHSL